MRLTHCRPRARPVLRDLLRQPLRFTPIFAVTHRRARFEMLLRLNGMLAGYVRDKNGGVPGQN
jgi:hypothetical protein